MDGIDRSWVGGRKQGGKKEGGGKKGGRGNWREEESRERGGI